MHVQRAKGIAGSERHLLALLPELRARGIDVQMSVLCTGDGARFVDEMRASGVETHAVRGRGHVQPELTPLLYSHIRRFRPDVVHTHLVDADVYGQLAAAAARVPGVSSAHGTPRLYLREPYRSAGRLVGRLARRRIAISEHVGRFLTTMRLAPPERVRVVPYGIRMANGHAGGDAAPRLRAENGWPHDAFVVGIVARLIEGKGHDRLVQAVARAARVCPATRLLVVGDGPDRASVEAAIRREGAEGLVRMLGFVDDVRPLVDVCNVIAVPTEPELSEGFGLAALEAMAAGKPVIATDVGSLPEVVLHGVTGIVVAPKSTDALVDALVAVASDVQLAATMGAAGRVRAANDFTLDRMVDSTIAVYEEVA